MIVKFENLWRDIEKVPEKSDKTEKITFAKKLIREIFA